ncbi:MAG: hypothetical protein RLZZ182_2222 [Pseudomonadota bacterium]|jgi:hypothetical protein
MATNKPSAAAIRSLDLREINNALNGIRQQLFTLGNYIDQVNLKAGQNALNSGGSSSTLLQLQQQVAVLQQTVSTLVAGGSGPTGTYRADAAVSTNDPVFVTSDGGVSPVDTQDPAAIFAAIGVATADASAGGQVVVRRSGVQTVGGASFETGRAVYAQVGSGLTQWPNYADVAIPVGVAVSEAAFEVRTAWPAQQTAPIYAGGYEDFLPVTYGLVRSVLEMVESIYNEPDGIVVKIGHQFVTREIVTPSGSGLDVQDGDGVFGNPSIS